MKTYTQILCFLAGIFLFQEGYTQRLHREMMQLKQSDRFEEARQEIVETLLSSDISNLRVNLILSAGYLQLTETKRALRRIGNDRNASTNIRVAAHKALARMGDRRALNFLISNVEQAGMNDNVVAVLFPDLIYTQQRRAFDVIIDALFDDVPRCRSSNPNLNVAILCGFRIMEMLAPLIKDFPLEVHASGDIKTDCYREALEITRQWFREHRTSYVILTDRF